MANLLKGLTIEQKLALAGAPDTSPEKLKALAKDPESTVRREVCSNPNLPERTLKNIARLDKDPKVREHAFYKLVTRQ